MEDNLSVTIQGRKIDGIYRFTANEWPNEDSEQTVRAALEIYRDELIESAKNIQAILDSKVPEQAEDLMINNPVMQINEVILNAPDISTEKVKSNIDFALKDILKPKE